MPDLSWFSLLLITACGSIDSPSHQLPDAGTGSACVAESDAELCAAAAATCELITATDHCGVTRTAACGVCGGTDACVANACVAPVCNSLSWPTESLVTSLNAQGKQDAPLAISSDGKTVLTQQGTTQCGDFQLIIADSNGTSLVPQNITANPMLAGMLVSQEGTLTLTPDGLTIIGTSTDGHSFLASKRAAFGGTVFAAATNTEFANLTVTGRVDSPVITADGLDFYYRVSGDDDAAKDGIYESVRTSTSVPFPAGTRVPDDLQIYQAVTGISRDRMTLFLQTGSFSTVALTRKSVTQPFTNPNAPGNPPAVPGFRTRPSGDCQSVLATATPGGCAQEENAIFSR